MKILIAEDDPKTRRLLEVMLTRWGHEVVAGADGIEAWATLQREDAPPLAILDVMMPGLDGLQVCRNVRQSSRPLPTYIILLTAKKGKENTITGLEAGADDYVIKPFDLDDLRARVRVGVRVIGLQKSLADRVRELEDALSQVKQLQGLLPICSYCKKIRDDQNYWQQVETYLTRHADLQFSHAICPSCYQDVVKPELEKWKSEKDNT